MCDYFLIKAGKEGMSVRAFSFGFLPFCRIVLVVLTHEHSNMISREAVLKISGQNSNRKASKPLIEQKRGFFFVHPLFLYDYKRLVSHN